MRARIAHGGGRRPGNEASIRLEFALALISISGRVLLQSELCARMEVCIIRGAKAEPRCTKINGSQVDLKTEVRTEFINVWGEYKNLSNPYIQCTTVPCDVAVF